jgi:cytochrome c
MFLWRPVLGLAACAGLAACTTDEGKSNGVRAGATQITRNACGSCHEIPGIEEAVGRVGPSLRHFATRQMIAGRLANTPGNLQRWLKSPQGIAPGNAMPDQGLTDQQAHDVALYLEQLK